MDEDLPEDLRNDAEGFADSLPASVLMPAGAGKTHLLAATVRLLAEADSRVLVLTHTNAGVHAIRARLKRFGVPADRALVATITSFAISVARPYPVLGGVRVPATPDMDDAGIYLEAATRVTGHRHIRGVLAATFSYALVDEYQDCNEAQHAFVLALKTAIPRLGVLGDPLQAIFGFKDKLPDWNTEVVSEFPDYPLDHQPRRWDKHNQNLGRWLHDTVRGAMYPRRLSFDPSSANYPPGVTFIDTSNDYPAIIRVAMRQRSAEESVLILAAREPSARALAGRLNGAYKMMEEVAGNFMVAFLESLAAAEPEEYALWLFDLTKKCTCGHGKLDKDTVRRRYVNNKTSAGLIRAGLEPALAAFDAVVENPTLTNLMSGMGTIPKSKSLTLHSPEAWCDIQAALRGAVVAGNDKARLLEELAKARESVRHTGRRNRNRVISRTLLVKGLEYDHVIIANISDHDEVHDLYVALTRARKTITILGARAEVDLKPSPNGPKV